MTLHQLCGNGPHKFSGSCFWETDTYVNIGNTAETIAIGSGHIRPTSMQIAGTTWFHFHCTAMMYRHLETVNVGQCQFWHGLVTYHHPIRSSPGIF